MGVARGRGSLAVQAHSVLCENERYACRDPREVGLHHPLRGRLVFAHHHPHARGLEVGHAAAIDTRVRVQRGHVHFGDACLHDRWDARERAPVVVARLQRDVEGCASRLLAGLRNGHGLGMRSAGGLGDPLADDAPVADEHRAHGGVGAGIAEGLAGQLQRPLHGGHGEEASDSERVSWSTRY